MAYQTTGFRMGPEFTSSVIKKLIFYTTAISLTAALLQNVFIFFFGIPGPLDWLSLSWWGMQNYMWWQPITFLFTHHTLGAGIHFFFLLTLFFNMYLLWIFGSDIQARIGTKPFLRFYFLCGSLAGLIAFFLMPVTGQYGIISGATPAILSLLIVWTMINPESEILFFFLIPVKAKWLTLGIVAAMILISLSNVEIVSFTLYLSGALIGYFYGLIALGLHSPFEQMYKFELAVIRTASKFRFFMPHFKRGAKKSKKEEKIVDFPKKNDNDEAFIDAMLEKISKQGHESLTWQERKRMDAISKKKGEAKHKDSPNSK